MNPKVVAAIKAAEVIIPLLVRAWQASGQRVPLQDWLGAFGRGRTMDEIIEEARQRKASQESGSAPDLPAQVSDPSGRRVATATEILEAAQTGRIPEWFSQAEKYASEDLRKHLLRYS